MSVKPGGTNPIFLISWYVASLGSSNDLRRVALISTGKPFCCCPYKRLVNHMRMREYSRKLTQRKRKTTLIVFSCCIESFSEQRLANRIASILRADPNHNFYLSLQAWPIAQCNKLLLVCALLLASAEGRAVLLGGRALANQCNAH